MDIVAVQKAESHGREKFSEPRSFQGQQAAEYGPPFTKVCPSRARSLKGKKKGEGEGKFWVELTGFADITTEA